MSSSNLVRSLNIGSVTWSVYEIKRACGEDARVTVKANQKYIKAYSLQNPRLLGGEIPLQNYYPKKNLEAKMERAAIEYVATWDSITDPMP